MEIPPKIENGWFTIQVDHVWMVGVPPDLNAPKQLKEKAESTPNVNGEHMEVHNNEHVATLLIRFLGPLPQIQQVSCFQWVQDWIDTKDTLHLSSDSSGDG